MRNALVVVFLAAIGPGAQPDAAGVERLAWLQGCWEGASADGTIEEFWAPPRGGSMVGMSRTVRRGELAGYELVVVRERGDRLVYIAHPSGQASAEFLSTSLSGSRVVFENPQHDYPQRIGYERTGARLQGWIEGAKDGRTRRIEFPYRRVACPAD